MIAAGEVIERPASGLKELLENAIDAGAKRIKIRVGGGGLHLLSVEDDGVGIAEESLPFLFRKHATSKIATLDDVANLDSYGFRGEALHSLGVMGEVTVCTASQEARLGRKLVMNYGVLSEPESVEKRSGTMVTVRNLFGQTPARRKFLKTERGEKRALQEMARKFAAFFYEIEWILEEIEDGIRWQRLPESRSSRLAWAFDSQSSADWETVQWEGSWGRAELDYVKLSKIGTTKAGIFVFINQRPVKDSSLEFAVKRAFESFTDRPREISALLRLAVRPELVDPNIHPRKLEVGLVARDDIVGSIIHAMREHLSEDHRRELSRPMERPPMKGLTTERAMPWKEPDSVRDAISALQSPLVFREPPQPHRENFAEIVVTPEPHQNFENNFTVLGEIDQTFLVVKRGEELLLFDQHALHERILYEELQDQMQRFEKLPSQRKLFPEEVKVEGLEALLDDENLLESLGYEIRTWGSGGFQLVAAPALVKRGHTEILRALVESHHRPREVLLKSILETLACHSAVRAHDVLDRREAIRLVQSFFSLPNVGYCPHGRPTFIRWGVEELEKLFHRVR